MTVYGTVIIRALDVMQLQKLNPSQVRGGGGGAKSIDTQLQQTRERPHVRKHLRKATNLSMLMRK